MGCLGALSLASGVWLYFSAGATYEGFELMTAMTVAILCWPAFHSLFTWRMAFLALLIIAPISLVFQCLAVEYRLWVYGNGPFRLGRMPWWGLEMPWMEVVFYFLFPMFQLGLFALCCRIFPIRPIAAPWSLAFPIVLLAVPVAFLVHGAYLAFHPWQSGDHPFDWNCAIMGTAFVVTLLAYAMSRPYRRFVRSLFFAAWMLGMGTYMLFWEWFHTTKHDHWRYVLENSLFPPWRTVDAVNGLGLSQAQLYGYFMTAVTFPAIAFLVARIWNAALRPLAHSFNPLPERIHEPV